MTYLMILSSVPNTYIGGKYLTLPFCFLLSEISSFNQYYGILYRSRVLLITGLTLLATFALFVNSPHYNQSVDGFFRLVNKELIGKYFFLLYGFICALNIKSWKVLLNVTFCSLAFITIIGVINLALRHAHFVDIAMQGAVLNDITADMGGKYEYQDRFRVQATFQNPFNYGFICVLNLFIFMYAKTKKQITKKQYYIALACSLFGIVFCGCRTVVLVAAMTFLIYLMLTQNLSKKLKYFVIILVVSQLTYEFVNPVRNLVDNTLTVFQRNQYATGGGSSIEMRQLQYLTVLTYTRNNMLFGRGMDFYREDLGWKNGRSGRVDEDLQGLEGVLMSYLLERGIVGIFFYLTFIGLVFFSIWKLRKIDYLTSSLAVSLLSAYFLFANMTGELDSFRSSFLLIGAAWGILFKHGNILRMRKNLKQY